MKPLQTDQALVRWSIPVTALALMSVTMLTDWNKTLFLFINHWSEITEPDLWSCLTMLGDEGTAIPIAMTFLVWRRQATASVLVAILLTYLMVHGLKPIFDIPRPPAVFNANHQIIIIGRAYHNVSFPSGHSATICTLIATYILASPQISRLCFAALLFLALTVGFSRCVVGVHWPADVFGGMAIGWLSAVLAQRLAGSKILPVWAYYFCLFLFLGCTIFVIFFYDPGYPYARIFFIVVGSVCLFASSSYFTINASKTLARQNEY